MVVKVYFIVCIWQSVYLMSVDAVSTSSMEYYNIFTHSMLSGTSIMTTPSKVTIPLKTSVRSLTETPPSLMPTSIVSSASAIPPSTHAGDRASTHTMQPTLQSTRDDHDGNRATTHTIQPTLQTNLYGDRTTTYTMQPTFQSTTENRDSSTNLKPSTISLPLWAWAVLVVSGVLLLSSSLILILLGVWRWQKKGYYDTHKVDGPEVEQHTTNTDEEDNPAHQQDTNAEAECTDGGYPNSGNIDGHTTAETSIQHESQQPPSEAGESSSRSRDEQHMTRQGQHGRSQQQQLLRKNRTDTALLSYDIDEPTFSTFRRTPRNKKTPAAGNTTNDHPGMELLPVALDSNYSDVGYDTRTL